MYVIETNASFQKAQSWEAIPCVCAGIAQSVERQDTRPEAYRGPLEVQCTITNPAVACS